MTINFPDPIKDWTGCAFPPSEERLWLSS